MSGFPKVRELRRANNLSQQQFAEKVESSGAYIQQIENGNRNLSNKMAKKIEAAFGVPWYSLYEDAPHNDTG